MVPPRIAGCLLLAWLAGLLAVGCSAIQAVPRLAWHQRIVRVSLEQEIGIPQSQAATRFHIRDGREIFTLEVPAATVGLPPDAGDQALLQAARRVGRVVALSVSEPARLDRVEVIFTGLAGPGRHRFEFDAADLQAARPTPPVRFGHSTEAAA